MCVDSLDIVAGLVARDMRDPGLFRRACMDLGSARTIRLSLPGERADQLAAFGVLCSALEATADSISVESSSPQVGDVIALLGLKGRVAVVDAPRCVPVHIRAEYGQTSAGSDGVVVMGPCATGGMVAISAATYLWAAAAVAGGVLLSTSASVPTRLEFALDDSFVVQVYRLVGQERMGSEEVDHAVLETVRTALDIPALPTLGLST